jgi:hypothetical protein
VTKRATVKPMPAQTPRPAICRQPADGEVRGGEDADGLADEQAEQDADGDGFGGEASEGVAGERDTGVGEREDGDDDVGHPRGEGTFEAFEGAGGVHGEAGDLGDEVFVVLELLAGDDAVVVGAFDAVDEVADLAGVAAG